EARNRVVGLRIGTALPGLGLQQPEIEPSGCAGQLSSNVQGHLLAAVGIDPDLPAEKQGRIFPVPKNKGSPVLQEERALLGQKDLEGSRIESLGVDIGIGEVGVNGEVGNHVAA